MASTLLLFAFMYKSKSANKVLTDRIESLPEVIELIISGLQAGMSISETLANLARIGPSCIKEVFVEFENHLRNGGYFENELTLLKDEFKDPLADQLFESLIYANKFGGRNAVKILHELAEFIANDLSLRSEISARFGWVKNSASLAAAAPWLLYLILRTQENAKSAYAQSFGQILMIIGFVLTVIAYFWMQKIATLPRPKRVFIRDIDSVKIK